MINIGGNPLMIILAIIAALGGVGLYFVRNFRPELARDHDIFFSAIALVYGIILLAFNFRMEITTQLAQVLVVGFAGWFAVESLILRQALSTQARRSPMDSMIDDDPVSPDYPGYRVEIDASREIPARRSSNNTRRMRGTGPSQSARPTELRGDVDQEKRSRRRRGSDSVIDIDDEDIRPVTPKQRRPRPSSDRPDSRDNRNDDEMPDASSPRRRRPTSKPDIMPDPEADEREDY